MTDIRMNHDLPLAGGRATVVFTSREVRFQNGTPRFRGTIYHADGRKLENILAADLAEVEARAEALVAKGKI